MAAVVCLVDRTRGLQHTETLYRRLTGLILPRIQTKYLT